MKEMNREDIIAKIDGLVGEYLGYKSEFIPYKSKVQYSGPVYDKNEIMAIIDTLLKGWFGLAEKGRLFEVGLSDYIGVKNCIMTNSGSSANLLAITALMDQKLEDRLKPGDEVITPAVTFPTTVNPVFEKGMVPVFIDVDLDTLNINADLIEKNITEKTRLLLIPHTLGNPADMTKIKEIADKYKLFIIEDCCDALGSMINGRKVGSIGDIATFSFYVAHHITMGEGGAALTNSHEVADTIRSLRDWGRSCICSPCKISIDHNYICPLRYNLGNELKDYDRRYIYSRMGYNLKPLEMQAAMGLEQLKRIDDFKAARKKNFDFYMNLFENYQDYFILPKSYNGSEPSWFSFPVTIREDAPFTRKEIIDWLEESNIETRLIFAGNIIRQPGYVNQKFKTSGELKNSDTIMKNSFFIGIYPGLTEEQLEFTSGRIKEFINKYKNRR